MAIRGERAGESAVRRRRRLAQREGPQTCEPSSKVCFTRMSASFGCPAAFFSVGGVYECSVSNSLTFHMFTTAVSAAGTTSTAGPPSFDDEDDDEPRGVAFDDDDDGGGARAEAEPDGGGGAPAPDERGFRLRASSASLFFFRKLESTSWTRGNEGACGASSTDLRLRILRRAGRAGRASENCAELRAELRRVASQLT